MVAYFFLIIAERVSNVLPRNAALGVGRFLGNLWYFLDARRRHVAKRNLLAAYSAERTYAEICRLARNSFRHIGMAFIDSLCIGKHLGSRHSDLISVEGIEHAEAAFRNGKGLLLATPHFGNWELLALLAQQLSGPLHSVTRAIVNPHIERHVLRTRKLWGMHLIDKKNAARRILSCLRENSAVIILMDQNAGGEGIYVNFFGRRASTFATVASLARRTGAPVLILYSVMDDDKRYRFVFETLADMKTSHDVREDVLRMTAAITARFEQVIREHPQQYFWVHQRWKPIQNEVMKGEFRRVENVIIKGPNWIGDVVMSLPAIAYVRKVFPEANIQMLIKEHLSDLVCHNRHIDGVMTYRRRRWPARLLDEWSIVRRIRRQYFNLAVIFPYSISSALWMFLAGVAIRLGSAARGRRMILTHTIGPPHRDEHQADYFLRMARMLGTKDIETGAVVTVGPNDEKKADDIMRELCAAKASYMIGIHPGAAYGPAKRWLAERFAELAVRLTRDGMSVVVFGSPDEKELVDGIIAQTNGTVANLCGNLSLAQFTAMLKRCDVVVTNDSGPMHLAGSVGAKVVAIFGSTSPDATSPTGKHRIIWKNTDCSPCFKRRCPTDFKCMKSITTDEVYSAVRDVLNIKDKK